MSTRGRTRPPGAAWWPRGRRAPGIRTSISTTSGRSPARPVPSTPRRRRPRRPRSMSGSKSRMSAETGADQRWSSTSKRSSGGRLRAAGTPPTEAAVAGRGPSAACRRQRRRVPDAEQAEPGTPGGPSARRGSSPTSSSAPGASGGCQGHGDRARRALPRWSTPPARSGRRRGPPRREDHPPSSRWDSIQARLACGRQKRVERPESRCRAAVRARRRQCYGSSVRSRCSMSLISFSEPLALALMARSGSRARSGSWASAASAASDCTAITLRLCATLSCNSRAIRTRSSATASRARSRWCCSACETRLRHSRLALPSNQVPPNSSTMNR